MRHLRLSTMIILSIVMVIVALDFEPVQAQFDPRTTVKLMMYRLEPTGIIAVPRTLCTKND